MRRLGRTVWHSKEDPILSSKLLRIATASLSEKQNGWKSWTTATTGRWQNSWSLQLSTSLRISLKPGFMSSSRLSLISWVRGLIMTEFSPSIHSRRNHKSRAHRMIRNLLATVWRSTKILIAKSHRRRKRWLWISQERTLWISRLASLLRVNSNMVAKVVKSLNLLLRARMKTNLKILWRTSVSTARVLEKWLTTMRRKSTTWLPSPKGKWNRLTRSTSNS